MHLRKYLLFQFSIKIIGNYYIKSSLVLKMTTQTQGESKNFMLVLFLSKDAKTFSTIRDEEQKLFNCTTIRVKDGNKWHNGEISW